MPEGVPSGSRQHYRTSKSLQKPPASTRAESHQKMNFAPAWNANGVLPGAIWLMKPSAEGSGPWRVSFGSDARGLQLNPICPAGRADAVRGVVKIRVRVWIRIYVAAIGQVVEVTRKQDVIPVGDFEVLLDARIQLGKSGLIVRDNDRPRTAFPLERRTLGRSLL